MKKTVILVIGLLAIALLAIALMPKTHGRKGNGVPLHVFNVGDTFSGYTIYNDAGTAIDIGQLQGERKVIIFAWDKCGDCRSQYENYSNLIKLYDNQNLDIIFIWDDKIPVSDMNNAQIPLEKHYSANGKVKFTDWVPTYFVVDKNNKITKSLTDIQDLEEYLSGVYTPKNEALLAFLDSRLIFFTLEGCSGCATAKNELSENSIVSSLTLYTVLCGEKKENSVFDYHDSNLIYAHALGIDSFPAFAVVSEGKVHVSRTIDELINMGHILKGANR